MSPEEKEAQRVAYASAVDARSGSPMPRSRLVVNVGNLLEVLGLVALVIGVLVLYGAGWALIVGGVLAVGSAQLLFDGIVAAVPLPRRTHRVRRAAYRLRVGVRAGVTRVDARLHGRPPQRHRVRA